MKNAGKREKSVLGLRTTEIAMENFLGSAEPAGLWKSSPQSRKSMCWRPKQKVQILFCLCVEAKIPARESVKIWKFQGLTATHHYGSTDDENI